MFFGMVRQSCGGSDHPTANQFLYAYRLMSANSLIKPPRRASVTSQPVQMLASVKSTSHQTTTSQASVQSIEQYLDNLLQNTPESSCNSDSNLMSLLDHDYDSSDPEKCIMQYLSGYVAHKLRKFTSCTDCVQLLVAGECTTSSDKLILLKTLGGLQIPSVPLTRLLTFLEQCVQKHTETPHADVYTAILNEALASDELVNNTVGCSVHCSPLTARCVHFYIVTRLYFLRKSINRNRKSNQEKKKLSKLSKLT